MNAEPLEFRALHILRGPNIWSNSPVIEAWVDLKDLKDTASNEVPGFNNRLIGWLPSMVEHRCSVGTRGGFFERLRDGTYPAHILEHVCLELQSLAGPPVGYGKARGMTDDGLYRVIVRYRDEPMAVAALHEARALVLSAIHDQPFSVPAAVDRLRAKLSPANQDPSLEAIRAAAAARDIPLTELARNGLVQLGYGAHQRRYHAGLTDATGAVGEEIAADRGLHRPLLRQAGVPVPASALVDSPEEAAEVVASLGTAAIIKPFSHDSGPGVSPPLTEAGDVSAAFHAARAVSGYIAVEQVITLDFFDVLVAEGAVRAAVLRTDANDPESATEDVSRRIDQETAAIAVEAARVAGLDVAGIVLRAEDISRPPAEQHVLIQAVHARPSLGPFLSPRCSPPLPVADELMRILFADGAPARIPLIAVTGGSERIAVAHTIYGFIKNIYRNSGMAVTGAVTFGGRTWRASKESAYQAARSLLMHPEITAGVVEVARAQILTEGLGFDRCSVAAISGLDDHAMLPVLNWGFEDFAANLPRAERCLAEVVLPGGCVVLNADEPRLESIIEYIPEKVHVTLTSRDETNAWVNRHAGAGGRSLIKTGNRLCFREGRSLLEALDESQAAGDPHVVLPALAAAWAIGVPLSALGARLLEHA